MYYKVNRGSKLFIELIAHVKSCEIANQKAAELAKEISGHNVCKLQGGIIVAGGIHRFCFKEGDNIPDGLFVAGNEKGWRLYKTNQRYEKSREIARRITLLPKVTLFDYLDVLKIDLGSNAAPGMSYRKGSDFILLSFTEECLKLWNKPDDVQEITYAQFIALKARRVNKEKEVADVL